MAGIARGNIDYATTHSNSSNTHTQPNQTIYVGKGSVYVNGQQAIVKGDKVRCGEEALGSSSTVFIGGKGVHRKGDACDSHKGTYSPSICATGSTNVFAN